MANTRGPGKNSRKAGPHWSPKHPKMWRLCAGLVAPGERLARECRVKRVSCSPCSSSLLSPTVHRSSHGPASRVGPCPSRPILSGQRCSHEGRTVPSGHAVQPPPGAHGIRTCQEHPDLFRPRPRQAPLTRPTSLAPPPQAPPHLAGPASPGPPPASSWIPALYPQSLPVSPALRETPARMSPPLQLSMAGHRQLDGQAHDCSAQAFLFPLLPGDTSSSLSAWGPPGLRLSPHTGPELHPGLWPSAPPLPPKAPALTGGSHWPAWALPAGVLLAVLPGTPNSAVDGVPPTPRSHSSQPPDPRILPPRSFCSLFLLTGAAMMPSRVPTQVSPPRMDQ